MDSIDNLPLSPISYVSKQESIAIEQNAFDDGIKAFDLMQNAGKSIANYVVEKYDTNKSVLILAGSGNNGGDGAVAANYLTAFKTVKLIYIKPAKANEAKLAFAELDSDNCIIHTLDQDISLGEIYEELKKADIIIDAIFGIGLNSAIRAPYKEILDKLSATQDDQVLISVDVPSGMDTNTGEWYCTPYSPHTIISMQHSKKCFQNLDETIEVVVPDIGIDPKYGYYVTKNHLIQFWPKRDLDSHKGQNGRIMVIGGSDEFTGAPVLSGMATMRSGVDTLRIAVPETIRDIVASYAEDFIVVKVRGPRITSKGFNKYREMAIRRHDVIVIGMGMSNHPDCNKFTRDFFEYGKEKIKFVLDAEAIRAFKQKTDLLKNSKGCIITPHRAELRMMLNEELPDSDTELIAFIQEKAKELGITILLKGRIDIISNGHRTILNKTGHPGMTVGGSGDVLAGVVAACYSYIEDEFMATAVAAFLMGKAGEKAAAKYGYSLLASDIIKEIPGVLMNYGLNV